MKKFLLLLPFLALALVGCNTTAYQTGVAANLSSNTQFQYTQNEQLNTIQMCYIYSKNTEQCSILAAGAIPTQVLGGRPTPIRVAKAPEEIFAELATNGFEAAVKIYGIKQVSGVISKGMSEAGKVEVLRPEIVRPEIVRPEVIFGGAGG